VKVCPHELLFQRATQFTQAQIIRVSLDDFIEHSFSDGVTSDIYGVWSRDGTKVAFVRAGSDLWVVDRDGQNAHKVDSQPSGLVAYPDWSPDGAQIAYEVAPLGSGVNHIFTASTTGTAGVNITTTAEAEGPLYWSPDGTKIAFSSNRTGNYDVFKMNPAGGDIVNLTNRSLDDTAPRWSPDGSKIVFMGPTATASTSIWAMNADGTNPMDLFNSNGGSRLGQAVWNADGTKVFYVQSPDVNAELYVMNQNGTNVHALDGDMNINLQPEVSPDGTMIAWSSQRTAGHAQIWVENIDGTSPVRVTNSADPDSAPHWRPCP